MPTPFISTIKLTDDRATWYIDVYDPTADKHIACQDLEAYEQAVVELSSHYPDAQNTVEWQCDSDVPPMMMDDIRLAMLKLEEKYRDLITS